MQHDRYRHEPDADRLARDAHERRPDTSIECGATVVVVGPDPSYGGGGIATALRGTLSALNMAFDHVVFLPTHQGTSRLRNAGLFLRACIRIATLAARSLMRDDDLVVFVHPGRYVSLLRKCLLILFGRMLGAKCILQVHSPETLAYLRSNLALRLFRIAIKPAHLLIVLTPWWRETLKAAGVSKPQCVVPNAYLGTTEETSSRFAGSEDSHDSLNILAVSRLVEGKGLDVLLDAMALLPTHVRLVIAGEGRFRAALQSRCVALGLTNRVTFAGWQSGIALEQAWQQCDVFCLPSENDSFGMVYLEAMARGKPVVALRWGPISEVVPDGVAGILCDRAAPVLIAHALSSLSDPQVRLRLGAGGQSWVGEQFSVDLVARRLQRAIKWTFTSERSGARGDIT